MQFAIIKLAMTMIEQEWFAGNYHRTTHMTIADYGSVYRGVEDYMTKLGSAWFVLNKLKANY